MTRIATISPYRLRYRKIIADVLAGLPIGATFVEKVKALKNACPCVRQFAGDGNSHRYKMWLLERKLALRLPPKSQEMPTCRIVLSSTPREITPLVGEPYMVTPWLTVDCQWCNGRSANGKYYLKMGCLVCDPFRQDLARVVALSHWKAMQRAVKSLDCPPEILADWLEEQGLEYAAQQAREAKEKDHDQTASAMVGT